MITALVFSAFPPQVARAQTGTLTFPASADTFVIAEFPDNSYGGSTIMRVDGSPIARSYLRFAVSGLNGASIVSAKLRIFANSSNSAGYSVAALSDNNWGEKTITYTNAPAPGGVINAAVVAGQWVETDVTSYIQGEGSFNLVLTPINGTNINLASRGIRPMFPRWSSPQEWVALSRPFLSRPRPFLPRRPQPFLPRRPPPLLPPQPRLCPPPRRRPLLWQPRQLLPPRPLPRVPSPPLPLALASAR